jgi:putative ABC transport system permease protein
LLSVVAGSAILVAVLSVPSSVRAAADHVSDLLPPGSLIVRAHTDTGVPTALADELLRVPGVSAAAPIVRHRVMVGKEEVTVLGVDGRFLKLGGTLKPTRCGFKATDLIAGAVSGSALEAHVGRPLDVRSPDGQHELVRVTAVAHCDLLNTLDGGRVLLTSLPVAASLTGRPDHVDLVAVAGRGRDPQLAGRLRTAVADRASVQSLATLTDQARGAVAPLEQGITVVAGITLVVAGFIVFNTMSMAVNERRRQFAVLRAIGSRRRSTRRGLLVEGFLLGLIGSILGAVIGLPLGRQLLGRAPRLIVDAVGLQPVFEPPAFLVPGVVIVVTLVAVAATLEPARQLAAVSPIEAMRGEGSTGPSTSLDARRLGAWAVITAVAAGVAFVAVSGPFALISMLLGIAASILFVMAVGDRLVEWVATVVARLGRAGRLAAIDLVSDHRRTLAILLAVVIAVSSLVGFRGMIDTLQSSYTSRLVSLADPDLALQVGRSDEIPLDHRLTDRLVAAVKAVPGVATVSRRSMFLLNDGDELVMAIGIDANSRDPSTEGVDPRAVLAMHQGKGVIVNATFARRRGLHLGDTVEIPTVTGERRLAVLGIGGYFALTPGGVLSFDFENGNRWFGRSGVSAAYVRFDRSADRRAVSAAVRSVAHHLEGDSVAVSSGDAYLGGFTARVREVPNLLNSILVSTVLAAGLAILSAVVLGLAERRRNLGVLRALGARRRTVAASLAIATVSLGIVGSALGMVVGLVLQPVHDHNVTELANGVAIDYRFSPEAVAIGIVGAAILLLVGASAPAVVSGRAEVLESLRAENA